MEKQGSKEVLTADQQALITPKMLKYVDYLAKRLHKKNGAARALGFEELVTAGRFGLTEAAARFNEQLGVTFITFATPRIRGGMLDRLRQVPGWNRQTKILTPLVLIGESHRLSHLFFSGRHVSGERDPFSDKDQTGMSEAVLNQASPETLAVRRELLERMKTCMATLSVNEQTVIALRYFQGATLEEIGKAIGLEKSWVCRLHHRALAKLQKALGEDVGSL